MYFVRKKKNHDLHRYNKILMIIKKKTTEKYALLAKNNK